MRGRPELLRGPVAADVKLIRTLPGWVAKGGAEGLFCAGSADGLAIVAKVEDGSFRAILPAVAHVLQSLRIDTGDLGVVPVENSHGECVGVVRIRR
jgi:L-asparaginase II